VAGASRGGINQLEEVGMGRIQWIRVLTLVIGLSLTACADGGIPTEPSRAAGPSFSSVKSDSAHARHEALKQALESRQREFQAMREASKDSLKVARAEWKAWKENWNEQYKTEKELWKRLHPGAKGGPDIQLLRCEPKPYEADAVIVGPAGGTLHVGPHELVIPKGALDHEELIVMEAPTSSLVDVRFQPEGLQFQRSAQLALSYKGCVVPTALDLLVAYLGQGNQILELPPSSDDRAGDKVEADIGHFSRYAVAW
jgi:hypothetical protein